MMDVQSLVNKGRTEELYCFWISSFLDNDLASFKREGSRSFFLTLGLVREPTATWVSLSLSLLGALSSIPLLSIYKLFLFIERKDVRNISSTHTYIPRSEVVSTLGAQPRGPGFESRERRDKCASLLMCI